MYFKKLELIGFKSFPEKTKIDFEPGITSIIGPNGCGKTNISDAIRWVLGETSAKTLRGRKMEDVIFNGTEVHKSLSMAEVSLTLNNEDKIIPIGYSEVTVTRRCYRSGESEYLINKKPCLLREIHELFMDTGIGTESYSVMEQGKVDLILSSKPEDRRFVLEEAAGIAKYNSRRDASLRKLELAQQNLLRIDDITSEVKREIISIKRQVTKAEKYRENYKRLKRLEINVGLKNYRGIKSELDAIQEKIHQFKDGSDKLAEPLHLKIIDIEKALVAARDKFLAAADRVNSIEKRGATFKERMEHLKARCERAHQEVNDIQEKRLEIQKRIEADEKEREACENIKEKEEILAEKENTFTSFLTLVENKEKELEEYKNRVFEKVREITTFNNDKEKINLNLANIEKRFARLTAEKQKRGHEQKDIFAKIDGLINGLRDLDKAEDIPQCSRSEIKRLLQEAEEISAILSGSKRKESEEQDIFLELKELEDERNSLDALLIQKKEALDSLEKERQSFKEEIDKEAATLQNLKLNLEEARETKEKARLSFAGLQEKKRGVDLHLETLKERLEEYNQNELRLKEEISQAEPEEESLKQESDGLEKERESSLKEKIFFKEEMDRFEGERKKASASVRGEEERLRNLYKLEISMTQKQAEMSSLKERISNLYHVDLDTLGEGEGVINEEQVKAEIEELRQKVEAMGSVNLMAIEENKELEDRFSLLKREREDILKAAEELRQVITRINHTCRQMFSETLERVRVEFHKIFRLLFNGGKADLVLQEGDILESGIEIVARPPGKNLSTITQLSGGEKALTAVALLFALFRIRPSPFCILDEIDAPLDDSNIGRFGSLLKEFLKTTQFIIITHSKMTISLAQVIYGITMEEPGISKIVSVKFGDLRN